MDFLTVERDINPQNTPMDSDSTRGKKLLPHPDPDRTSLITELAGYNEKDNKPTMKWQRMTPSTYSLNVASDVKKEGL